MGVTTNRAVIGSKRCPSCDRRGEWPGQPCPTCRAETPASAPERPVELAALDAAGVDVDVDPPQLSTLAQLHQRRRLDELADIANEAHAAILTRGRELIEYAIRSGDALLEARRNFPASAGGWVDWMERRLSMHVTTAYRYMRLAEHKNAVRAAAPESIKDAMFVLADLPRRGAGPVRYSEADKADWIKLVDQVGVRRAATLTGVGVATISKWASPNSPHRDRPRERSTRHPSINPDAIERLATWLVNRFGGYEYAERVTDAVRADALDALETALAIKEPDDA